MAAKTTKYVAGLLNFVSLFICQKGANAAQSSIDGMQAGLFRMLLEQVWLPAMGSPRSADQQKVLSVATTKVRIALTTENSIQHLIADVPYVL